MSRYFLCLIIVCCICLLGDLPLKSQPKYFEKTVSWADYHGSGYKVLGLSDSSFLVVGTGIHSSDDARKVHTFRINLQGDISSFNIYEQEKHKHQKKLERTQN